MSEQDVKPVTPASVDVDELVARYAPVGRKLRERRRMLRRALLALLPVLGIALIVAWQARGSITAMLMPRSDADRIEQSLAELRDLKAHLSAEAGSIAAQRRELARQQAVFSQQNEQLAGQLAEINQQRERLAAQSALFENQKSELARALAKAEEQRRELQARSGRQPDLQRQLAEIARQKQELEKQQKNFLDQGQVLAQELGQINQQRAEIERQRQAIEVQQAEVRKLLKQISHAEDGSGGQAGANTGARQAEPKPIPSARSDEESAPAQEPPGSVVSGEIATLAAVDRGELGEIRGGFDLGGLTAAVGITRTVDINGLEQFTSALYIEDLSRAVGTGNGVSFTQATDPAIIQNGPGNYIDPAVLANFGNAVPTIIQNTLDGQSIATRTVMDISLQNVSGLVQGLELERASRDGITLPR